MEHYAQPDLPGFLQALRQEFGAQASAAASGPIYLRLSARLRDAIQHGTISTGTSLPAERELARLLGLSRQTVRRAVEILTTEGLLVVRQGSGTYVNARFVEPLTELTSFSDDMRRRGFEPGSVWLERTLGQPTPEEALALGLSLRDRVMRASRVRTANGEPIAVEVAVVDARVVGMKADFGDSLYEAIRRQGHAPVRAMQRVRAAVASRHLAHLLHIATGAPVLETERHSYSAEGRLLEWTRSTYRGDLYDYVAEMRLAAPRTNTS
jgi:GntR family transcriptional regulator